MPDILLYCYRFRYKTWDVIVNAKVICTSCHNLSNDFMGLNNVPYSIKTIFNHSVSHH